jgi:hypothetical protein
MSDLLAAVTARVVLLAAAATMMTRSLVSDTTSEIVVTAETHATAQEARTTARGTPRSATVTTTVTAATMTAQKASASVIKTKLMLMLALLMEILVRVRRCIPCARCSQLTVLDLDRDDPVPSNDDLDTAE